jgi:hypothetical protein
MSTKIVLAGGGLLVGATLLTGCGSDSGDGSPPPSRAATTASAGGAVSFAFDPCELGADLDLAGLSGMKLGPGSPEDATVFSLQQKTCTFQQTDSDDFLGSVVIRTFSAPSLDAITDPVRQTTRTQPADSSLPAGSFVTVGSPTELYVLGDKPFSVAVTLGGDGFTPAPDKNVAIAEAILETI